MSTFDVSDVSVETGLLTASTLVADLQARLGTPVEACGGNQQACVIPVGSAHGLPHHGFLAAVHSAFAQHCPLVLSPDDVWLCIAQGIAIHMDVNAEAFRAQFVRHDGQASIQI
ncbi:MAG TPA: DUF4419 domain-containing protein, partial [Polyangiaceae bacterium]|nr:DUF4419 domain-containing protein [Polyangiaceae bacterium]